MPPPPVVVALHCRYYTHHLPSFKDILNQKEKTKTVSMVQLTYFENKKYQKKRLKERLV